MKNSPTINLTTKELKDINAFCKLNELDFDKFIKSCFNKGYQIEKYGLLTNEDGEQIIFEEKIVEKEVIKEVPIEVEKIVEKEIIREIPVEKIIEKEIPIEVIKEVPVEVIKEVEKEVVVEVEKPIEVIVEKEVYITDDEEVQQLGNKIVKLEKEKEGYDTQISEYIRQIDEKNSEKSELEGRISELEVLLEEKPKEVIKEIEIEKIVEKEVKIENKEKLKKLQQTISTMKDEIRKKDEKILQIEKNVVELEKIKGPIKAKFMGSTNLNDKLYR